MTDDSDHSWVLDGLEEGSARVEEDGARMIVVPRYLIPSGAKEGEVLRVSRPAGGGRGEKGSVTFTVQVDRAATEAALARSRATIEHASAESRKRDPGGDVVL